MTKSKIPKFTSYPPRGIFYYAFFSKSPPGDLGVKIFRDLMTLLLLVFIITPKTLSQDIESSLANIKIGMLITDNKSVAAVQGAELAIGEANEKGGLNGHHFQLVVRSMEGPWGTGSKQAVDLIFEEKVWALFGLHDGRNAHLVEQAATRSIVVFVSAWTGDPTLSQAFVPWFFNCVPNNNQQAASLLEEIYNNRKFKNTAIISDNDYDSKSGLNSFLQTVKESGKHDPVQFSWDVYCRDPEAFTENIIKSGAECIILFCQPGACLKIAQQIRQKRMTILLYGSLIILNENELSSQELKAFDNILSIPSGEWPGSENLAFRQKFQKTYNRMPGLVASYSYDGMKVLIEAIKNAGSSDREMIQKALENIHYKGVTGIIQFDGKGNRSGNFKVMKTNDGVPVNSD